MPAQTAGHGDQAVDRVATVKIVVHCALHGRTPSSWHALGLVTVLPKRLVPAVPVLRPWAEKLVAPLPIKRQVGHLGGVKGAPKGCCVAVVLSYRLQCCIQLVFGVIGEVLCWGASVGPLHGCACDLVGIGADARLEVGHKDVIAVRHE